MKTELIKLGYLRTQINKMDINISLIHATIQSMLTKQPVIGTISVLKGKNIAGTSYIFIYFRTFKSGSPLAVTYDIHRHRYETFNLLPNKGLPYGETVHTKSRSKLNSLHSIGKINVTNELLELHSSDSKEHN